MTRGRGARSQGRICIIFTATGYNSAKQQQLRHTVHDRGQPSRDQLVGRDRLSGAPRLVDDEPDGHYIEFDTKGSRRALPRPPPTRRLS